MTASNNVPEKNFNAKEERKLRKPLIEKRRRERINCSLEQLKGIMVDAYNLDQSKLEKADVLEITVQHMEGMQRGQGAGSPGSSTGFESRQRYSTGYIQCMHEVHNLLLSCPGMDKTLGARLLNHLLKSLPHISAETVGTPGSDGAGGSASGGSSPLPASPTVSPPSLPPGALQPRPPHLHSPSSCPPSPSSPRDTVPREGSVGRAREPPSPSSPRDTVPREGSVGRAREPPSPSSPRDTVAREGSVGRARSPSPVPRPGLAHPGLPPFLPGGDPSMWRPW